MVRYHENNATSSHLFINCNKYASNYNSLPKGDVVRYDFGKCVCLCVEVLKRLTNFNMFNNMLKMSTYCVFFLHLVSFNRKHNYVVFLTVSLPFV